MRCYICDKSMDEVKLDHRDMKTAPCSECESAVQECLEGYQQQEEDDEINVAYIEDEYETEYDDYAECPTDLDDA